MDNNQNFYPPQQNWNQPPTPPEKSKSGWVKWIIIGVLVAGLLTALIFFVANIGKKFGHTINDISQNALTKEDSLQANLLNDEYDSVYAMIARNSSSGEMKSVIDDLRNSSDSVVEIFNANQQGFNDTIGNASALSRMTQFWSQHYFLKTGRATKLKNMLLAYRENKIHMLPPYAQDSSLRYTMQIDDGQKLLPTYLSRFTGWENLNFNQPVMNVNINFRIIRGEIRNFEEEILNKYKTIIVTGQNSGIKIIMLSSDTVK